jgi:hypothetical protein
LAGANFHPDGNTSPAAVANFSGGAFAFDIAVGRTLSPGLTLGGLLYISGILGGSASFQSGKSLSTGSLSMVGVGPLVDYYFAPSLGWHVQAAAGYTFLMGPSSCSDAGCTKSSDLFQDSTGSAVSVMAGIGHDWWLAESMSMGLLARVGYTNGSITDPANFKLDLQVPVVSLQATGTVW